MKQTTWKLIIIPILLILTACGRQINPTPEISTTAPPRVSLATDTATITPSPEPTLTPTPIPQPPVTIGEVHMLDAANGWGIGQLKDEALQRVVRTNDSGATWQDVTPAQKVSDPASATTAALPVFSDGEHAWTVYYNPSPAPVNGELVVWFTTDGGATWQTSQPLEMPETMDFFIPSDLVFSDLQNGWLMAHLGVGMSHDYVALYHTTDGGMNWKRVVDPSQDGVIKNSLPMSCTKSGIAFQDGLTGWVSGSCNGVMPGLFLYQTTDGGTTWQPVQVPPPAPSPGLLSAQENVCSTHPPLILAPQTVFVMVSCRLPDDKSQGWLYQTTNGGVNWLSRPLPAAYGTMDFVSQGYAWILGGNTQDPNMVKGLFQTSDTGQTWTALLQELNWQGQIDFIDPENGWAVAHQGSSVHLLKTNDGGKTWVELKPVLLVN